MNDLKHICTYKKIISRYCTGPVMFIEGIDIFVILYNLFVFFRIKTQKMHKAELYKCDKCEQYKWVCPYCKDEIIMESVPRFKKCPKCKKTSFFDSYARGVLYLFQKRKKP